MDMHDDDLLRRYLSGELSEEAAEDVERRLLEDDDLFELAEAIEGELLAAYARGELAPDERERVLARLASSRSGQTRLALAQGLARIADERAKVRPFRPRTTEVPQPARRAVQPWLAVLAASLLVAVGLYTAYRHQEQDPVGGKVQARIGDNVPILPSPRVEPVPPAEETALPPAPTPAVPEPEQAPARPEPRTPAPPQPQIEVAVIQLAVANLRGGGNLPTFEIVQDSREVEFQIDPGEEGFVSYEVVLRDTAQRELWQGTIKPQTTSWGTGLVFRRPAADLPPGNYELEVCGMKADGTCDWLGTPRFEVRWR